jgi:AcrR family transcriptional regulator
MELMASTSDQQKRILDAATRLFAERGYDGVSTRLLGKAVGLNIATVNYHVGGKRELFDAVMRRLREEEEQRIGGYLQRFDPEAVSDAVASTAFIDGLIDALIDMMAEEPARPRLYLRRWLAPRDELTVGEVENSITIYSPLRSFLAHGQHSGWIRSDLDVDYFLRSFTWQLFGFFLTGPIDWERWYGDPTLAENLAGFKAFMRDYTRRMLGV